MSGYLFTGGRIVDARQDRITDLLIQGEHITAVGDIQEAPESVEQIDCCGLILMPGMIDTHTHMGIPIKDGFSADDFRSGSKSAMYGGITTILDP